MLKKIKQKIFISLAVAGLLYLGFTIYADYHKVAIAFKQFNWLLFPLLLVLSFSNYVIRFVKWDYYLRLLKVKMSRVDSFCIFMSGLIMSITPGKMGELLKSYLVKQITGEPISKTAPIIFVERITDFVSLVFIALIGAYIFNYGRAISLGVAIFFFLVVVIISIKPIALPIINSLEKIKFLKKYVQAFHNAYESSYQMLRPVPLINMVAVSLLSWFFECFGYYVILKNFDIPGTGILWSSFSYAFATIVGAITMLPAGLGVTEGSLTFMLVKKGASSDIAVATTFIIRVVTLWFAVLVGVVGVSFYQKRFGQLAEENIN